MKNKGMISGLAIMLSIAMLTGCGSSSTDTAKTADNAVDTSTDYSVETTEETAGYASEDMDSYSDEAADSDSYDSKGILNGYAYSASNETENTDSSNASTDPSVQDGQKLIYSGDISIQTLEYDKSVSDLKSLVSDNGGFIESQNESNSNYDWYYDDSDDRGLRSATFTVRIPSDKFNDFLDSMTDLGQVMNKTTSTENITRTYNDNDAHIAALQKEEERLLAMMDKAETVEEMVSVEQRLTEVETELNQANSSKSAMDTDIKYSTVDVSIDEVKKYSEIDKPDKYSEKLLKALKNSWHNLLIFFQELLIIILYVLPFALIILAVIFIIKSVAKKRKNNKTLPQNNKAYQNANLQNNLNRQNPIIRNTASGQNSTPGQDNSSEQNNDA